MIIDQLENFSRYAALPHFEAIVEFLKNHKVADLADGDYDVVAGSVIAKVFSYESRSSDQLDFETHASHMDIQVVLSGVEMMQVAEPSQLTVTDKPFIEMDGDWTFYTASGDVSSFIMPSGKFVVYFPHEPHKPGCSVGDTDMPMRKLVFKIKTA